MYCSIWFCKSCYKRKRLVSFLGSMHAWLLLYTCYLYSYVFSWRSSQSFKASWKVFAEFQVSAGWFNTNYVFRRKKKNNNQTTSPSKEKNKQKQQHLCSGEKKKKSVAIILDQTMEKFSLFWQLIVFVFLYQQLTLISSQEGGDKWKLKLSIVGIKKLK